MAWAGGKLARPGQVGPRVNILHLLLDVGLFIKS